MISAIDFPPFVNDVIRRHAILWIQFGDLPLSHALSSHPTLAPYDTHQYARSKPPSYRETPLIVPLKSLLCTVTPEIQINTDDAAFDERFDYAPPLPPRNSYRIHMSLKRLARRCLREGRCKRTRGQYTSHHPTVHQTQSSHR